MVKAITAERLQELYRSQLSGQHGELTIVGDFDPDAVLPRIQEMLNGWKSDTAYEEVLKPGDIEVAGKRQTILTPDKANATYFGATAFPVSDEHPDYPALVLGNFILGGGSLSSRLGDRVRQKDGLSYGVGSGFNAQATNDRSVFYLYAICNPDNMEKVVAAINEEVERIKKEGVTDEELKAARQGYLQQQVVSRSNDRNLTSILEETSHVGRSMDYYNELEKKINNTTPGEVRDTLNKYIGFDSIYIVTAGDFESAEKTSE
jgi:zinc protease